MKYSMHIISYNIVHLWYINVFFDGTTFYVGLGDMAVSNAIGSNVFDILVCLGVPWFIETCIKAPGSEVKVYSEG